MSISTDITRIQTNITNALSAITEKGVTVPDGANSDHLAELISSIEAGSGGGSGGGEEEYTGDATLLHITIADIARPTIPLCFRQSVANGVTVDWGDGSATETFSGSGTTNIMPMHTYSSAGDYVISLLPADGCTLTLGGASSSYCIMGANSDAKRVYQNTLRKVNIGNKGVTSIGDYAFQHCYSLNSITISSVVTSIGNYAFMRCYSLASLTISSSLKNIGTYAFSSCQSLSSLIIPNNVTGLMSSMVQSCVSLTNIIIPNSVTTIQSQTFYGCVSLTSITIPSGVSKIFSYTFQNCYGMKYYDFSEHTSVPTLSASNAFANIPSDCEIRVPSALYDEWIAATNWSTYADHIVGV